MKINQDKEDNKNIIDDKRIKDSNNVNNNVGPVVNPINSNHNNTNNSSNVNTNLEFIQQPEQIAEE